MTDMQKAAAAFKEIARVIRIAQVGGRRVQRFEQEQRSQTLAALNGPNRRQRRALKAEAANKKVIVLPPAPPPGQSLGFARDKTRKEKKAAAQ